MVYTWNIQGYSWIFLAPETRFLGNGGQPVLLVSFNEHMCVGDQFVFPHDTMGIVPWGKGCPQRAQPDSRKPPCGGGDGGGGGGVAGVFPVFLVLLRAT